MNWLQRARREIVESPARATVVTAERLPVAVMAVPDLALLANEPNYLAHAPNVDPQSLPDDLREAFEERAAIFEYDAGISRATAEAAALTAMSFHLRRH